MQYLTQQQSEETTNEYVCIYLFIETVILNYKTCAIDRALAAATLLEL